jgi:hypothetical protein
MIKNCEICSKEFSPKPSHVKVGWGRYCSSKCHYVSMRNGKVVHCDECGVEVYKNKIKLAHSKSGKFFCTKSCQTKWRNKYFSGDKHKLWISGESTYRKVMKGSEKEKICHRCSDKDERTLIVHHVDHDRKNYDIKNLIWLCRNCHFLIHYDKLEEEKLMVVVAQLAEHPPVARKVAGSWPVDHPNMAQQSRNTKINHIQKL